MRDERLSIGRKDAEKSDVLLDDNTISSLHAYIYFKDGHAYIEDNKSTNGTFIVRNEKLEKIDKCKVSKSDVLYFGEYKTSLNELISIINSKDNGIDKKSKHSCPACGMVILKDRPCPYCN